MSTSKSDEAIVNEIQNASNKVGVALKDAYNNPATASSIVYADANSKLAIGSLPMAVTQSLATTVSVLDVTGYATLSADEIMHGTLVAGAGVTTWTKTGFLQINVTDNAGNIVNGKHYIQFGTLT